MPIELQVKLLRVLESGSLTRIGGDEPIPVNVRLIAASNRVMGEAVREGKLREDLYYRLNVFPIALPPLREREGDSILLAEQFLANFNAAQGTSKRFSTAARRRIEGYAWRGNVRELKNEVHRAFILSENLLELRDLGAGRAPDPPALDVGGSLEESERRLILATLEHCGGDKKRAAQVLGISLKTLYNRLNVYAAS
jgi:DNA-binding NtrC family response regulator